MKDINIKIGNIVYFKEDQDLNSLGEAYNFKHRGPYIVQSISNGIKGCIRKMSGINVCLDFRRFEVVRNKLYKIY